MLTCTLHTDWVLIYIDPWLCGGPGIKLTHQWRNWWLHQTCVCVCVWEREIEKERQRKCSPKVISSKYTHTHTHCALSPSLEKNIDTKMTSRPESSAHFSAGGLWENTAFGLLWEPRHFYLHIHLPYRSKPCYVTSHIYNERALTLMSWIWESGT